MAMKDGAMFERKYLAHYVNCGENGTQTYQRLGEDLEEYSISMNAEKETKKNILGESTTRVKGYSPSSSVSPYYAKFNDPLFKKLNSAINNRSTGDDLKTDVVDVLIDSEGNIIEAWKEDVLLIPESYGGDTTGVQIPFTIDYVGNRKDVTEKVTITDGVLTIAE